LFHVEQILAGCRGDSLKVARCMKKKSVGIIFLTVLIDLVGFGLILPLIPLYGQSFGASRWINGAIMAAYSLMQFLFAPVWGRLSDRIGRRPVLLTSTACACLSYVIFALGSGVKDNPKLALAVILASRIFAGICGANITVAQAYIADITPPEQRSARMGLVGMAFGLGFILGPVLGAVSALSFGVTAPGWTAASLCAINFLWAFSWLAESWQPSVHFTTQRAHLEQWMHTLRAPRLNLLIGIFFLATFCFTCFESTVGLLVERNFKIAPGSEHLTTGEQLRSVLGKVGWLIAYCGLIGAVVQGGLMRRLVKAMGEPKLISASLFMAAIGIAVLPFLTQWGWLLLGLAVFSIGSSMTRPPVFGMISLMTAAHEQGAVLGVAQGVGSLARIVGPVFALGFFAADPRIPYLSCAVLCFVTGCIATRYLTLPKSAAGP
jgi:MFS family permease